jgi:hypothetical protein
MAIELLKERLDELRAAADQADEEYRAEIARLRLTVEEREAIAGAIAFEHGRGAFAWAATLRKLLERLG